MTKFRIAAGLAVAGVITFGAVSLAGAGSSPTVVHTQSSDVPPATNQDHATPTPVVAQAPAGQPQAAQPQAPAPVPVQGTTAAPEPNVNVTQQQLPAGDHPTPPPVDTTTPTTAPPVPQPPAVVWEADWGTGCAISYNYQQVDPSTGITGVYPATYRGNCDQANLLGEQFPGAVVVESPQGP